jgi:hypothetical protein
MAKEMAINLICLICLVISAPKSGGVVQQILFTATFMFLVAATDDLGFH